jgi:hypothetical protein
MLLMSRQQLTAAITASTASDIYYLSRKHLKSAVVTARHLQKLFSLIEIIAVDKTDCLAAFATGVADYEDSLLVVGAAKWNADYIVTRNVKDFSASLVVAITPTDFLLKWDGE